jgi:hypothetical protein
VSERLAAVQTGIREACESVGRDPASVTLVAVTKGRSVAEIEVLYQSGQRDFGESRLQEAEPKIAALPADTRWHFIGNLQSNKARKVADLFDVIHTLSTLSSLEQLAKTARSISTFVEVNIGEEPQKSGLFLDKLDEFFATALQYDSLKILGLMTVGPLVGESEEMRPYFRRLAQLALERGLAGVSMGMSSDYVVAIQEGATHVRIGSALFAP